LNRRFFIRTAEGAKRRVDAPDFPLAVGGAEADIDVPGPPASEPLAYLGTSEGEVFVQAGAGTVRVNGTPVATSQWLHGGDVLTLGTLRIELQERGEELRFVVGRLEDKKTDPPVVVGAPIGGEAQPVAGARIKPVAFTPAPITQSKHGPRVRPGAVAFWIALILLGSTAWAVFNARSVTFEFETEPDRFEVEGPPFAIAFGKRLLAHPGVYRMIAEKVGYRRLDTTFVVGEERSQTLPFVLEELAGRLSLTTTPAEGALVTIDGRKVGLTPLDPIELDSGEHTVHVSAERYHDFEATVAIGGKGTLETLEVPLEPAWAAVTFTSEPAGATVRLQGKSYGSTPVVVDLLEGTHRYDLVLEGHKTYQGRVRVQSGRAQSVGPARLALADGNLVVLSAPESANVTVNGEYRGQTPLELELAPGETYRLDLSRPGYDSAQREVSVRPAKSETITVQLTAQLGEIALVVDPPDAALVVDGEPRGAAQQVLTLPAAPHRIEIKKDSYESFVTDVTPRPDFPQKIEVQLKTLAEIKAASILPVIETSQGQKLRLIAPKKFEMGASRREPGRRANETLRTVELTRSFYLATTEVTNRQFREFREGHRSGAVKGHSLETDHHPVVRVTWQDAAAYCNWLSAKDSLPPAYVTSGGKLVASEPLTTGYRLPTEAEWALAARYATGDKLKYPWGNALPVPPAAGNYADSSAQGFVMTTVPKYTDTFPATAPVDSFEPNALAIFNLGGNVSEWVHDLYRIYPAGNRKIERDPTGPKEGEFHVIRGASYLHGSVTQLRLSFRDYGNKARPDVGFRIARYLE